MFNNHLEYIEEILPPDDYDALEEILENRAEWYATEDEVTTPVPDQVYRQSRLDSLLWAYRDIGHLHADLNPLGESYVKDFTRVAEFQEETHQSLRPEDFDLSEDDLDREFFPGKYMGRGRLPLREILDRFDKTYCSTVGIEFLHIQNRDIREWLLTRMEGSLNTTELSGERKIQALRDLIENEEFENFLHKSFIGQKRFSSQGADVVIPALHYLVDRAIEHRIEEIVMGTSHRGRLSILNQILHKKPGEIFQLFGEDLDTVVPGMGDVKYHIGYCTAHENDNGGSIQITLLPNSSHLESVDAIVEGNARGLQDLRDDDDGRRTLPVLLHGDASFPAQGVVAETFNLSRLQGYSTGGTVHVVINNQIGFTTSTTKGRSGLNPTDIARMLPVPIFHVNGDDPEAVLHVMEMALDYRQTFHRDVVVDVFCYRKYGHNEGDEPSYTQPVMYSLIEEHKSPAEIYAEKCIESGLVTVETVETWRKEFKDSFSSTLDRVKDKESEYWDEKQTEKKKTEEPDTSVEEKTLRKIIDIATTVPEELDLHRRLKRIIEKKRKSFDENSTVDWGLAETLAMGSLLLEKIPVRLSGQDSERGTFSHRHLVWWEVEKEDCCHYIPLSSLSIHQADFNVYNSPLSEYSVLAFEYGYAVARPDALVMWEAQFGDFVNGAQIIIDNYLIAAKTKWAVKNGLVLLLPHGYEGMGPEHSSAHMERFLLLCAEENMQVCNVSTPAQYFHLLRRQKKAASEIPLVIFTPKSLLRHQLALSPLKDFTGGRFRRIINRVNDSSITRLIFCTGKVYYDLLENSDEKTGSETGIVTIEQLYPFPKEELAGVIEKYGKVKEYLWVQEESRNRGAWYYMKDRFSEYFPEIYITYTGRTKSASPATGSPKQHNEEQQAIINAAIKNHRQN